MQRMSFDPKNKNAAFGDYPKLKLKKDERARVLCIEEPVFAYSHSLRAPTIVNGKAKMETVKRGNEEVEQYAMDFLGQPLCLGDRGILQDNGLDPKNCPVCEMARTTDMVSAPQRRFAMHVVKYATKQNSFEPAVPFSVQLVVWAYQDKVYNKLTDIVTEWGSLQNHDLLLGPCTVEMYQTFDIGVAAKAAWMESEENKLLVVTTFKENQTKDLESFCGRKSELKWLQDDLEKIRARWRVVNHESEEAAPSLAEGMTDLLATQPGGMEEFAPKSTPAAEPAVASPAALLFDTATKTAEIGTKAEDFIADKSTTTNGLLANKEETSVLPATPVVSTPEPISFEKLLEGLGGS